MIGKNSVVSLHYTLTDDSGEVMDSSDGHPPLVYLHGADNLIPGLESELQGKTAGAKFNATIAPKDAYGEVVQELIQVVDKSLFDGVDAVEPGMSFVAQGDDGGRQQIRVVAVQGDDVTIDANHPMAGMTLHFEVEVVDVRDATAQEIAHGHVHAHGHDH